MTEFEEMLSGGHPNSLGRTVDVVAVVLADRTRLSELYDCYFSTDDVVRMRVSSAVKRIATDQPDWVMDFIDGLHTEVAAIDQASNQWTLALLFDLLAERLSPKQCARSVEIMQANLVNHSDWIVLINSMKVLAKWADGDVKLTEWLRPHLLRLTNDDRKSVAKNARKLLESLSGHSGVPGPREAPREG